MDNYNLFDYNLNNRFNFNFKQNSKKKEKCNDMNLYLAEFKLIIENKINTLYNFIF